MADNFIKFTFQDIGISNNLQKWPGSSEKRQNVRSYLVKLEPTGTVGEQAALGINLRLLNFYEDVISGKVGEHFEGLKLLLRLNV